MTQNFNILDFNMFANKATLYLLNGFAERFYKKHYGGGRLAGLQITYMIR